jgi:pimeloyl-ACP methyl ester carboxylesterase
MRKETIEHDGLTLGLLAGGTPAKPALVLLHGWPHSKEVYDQVMADLAVDHFVLSFDLPAIGDSRGAPRSAEKMVLADILLSAAERAGAQSIVVAGFDVGGMIAYAAARDYGHRIAGAVVANTVLPGIEPWSKILADPRIWHFAFHEVPELPELLVAGRQRAYFDFFTDMLAGKKEAVSEQHREAFARAYQRPEALKAGFDWYRAMKADAERNKQSKPIQAPLLYLRGDADGRGPEDYLPGLKQAGVAHAKGGMLHGSGEFAPLEVPQAFIHTLATFSRQCREQIAA